MKRGTTFARCVGGPRAATNRTTFGNGSTCLLFVNKRPMLAGPKVHWLELTCVPLLITYPLPHAPRPGDSPVLFSPFFKRMLLAGRTLIAIVIRQFPLALLHWSPL